MSVTGQFFHIKATRQGVTWNFNIQQGALGPRNAVQISGKSGSESQKADSSSFWQKTAEFATRTLVATTASAIPFATANGFAVWNGLAPSADLILDTALFSAGIGLLSGAICDTVDQAGTCGFLLGTAAQVATTLGGVGSGSLLEKAGQAKAWSATKFAAGLETAGQAKAWIATKFAAGLETACEAGSWGKDMASFSKGS